MAKKPDSEQVLAEVFGQPCTAVRVTGAERLQAARARSLHRGRRAPTIAGISAERRAIQELAMLSGFVRTNAPVSRNEVAPNIWNGGVTASACVPCRRATALGRSLKEARVSSALTPARSASAVPADLFSLRRLITEAHERLNLFHEFSSARNQFAHSGSAGSPKCNARDDQTNVGSRLINSSRSWRRHRSFPAIVQPGASRAFCARDVDGSAKAAR